MTVNGVVEHSQGDVLGRDGAKIGAWGAPIGQGEGAHVVQVGMGDKIASNSWSIRS